MAQRYKKKPEKQKGKQKDLKDPFASGAASDFTGFLQWGRDVERVVSIQIWRVLDEMDCPIDEDVAKADLQVRSSYVEIK